MKVVALEENFATEQMLAAWRALRPDLQDIAVRQSTGSDVERRLFDLGPERIELMDKVGVQVQVLSDDTRSSKSRCLRSVWEVAGEWSPTLTLAENVPF